MDLSSLLSSIVSAYGRETPGKREERSWPSNTCVAPYRIIHIAPAITGCCDRVTLLLLLLKVINWCAAPCHATASSFVCTEKDIGLILVCCLFADFKRFRAGLYVPTNELLIYYIVYLLVCTWRNELIVFISFSANLLQTFIRHLLNLEFMNVNLAYFYLQSYPTCRSTYWFYIM